MKRTIAALLCLCMFLAACGKEPESTVPSTAATAAPTAAPTTEATTEPSNEATTEPTTEATTEPVVLSYRHPITGEALSNPCTVRPIAVVTNNYRAAQPVYGISNADMVFEHITEAQGNETRMLAIYTDLNFDDKLGTIRSARTYSIDLAASFDAIFVNCGTSPQAKKKINSMGYPTFDQFYNDKYFYRDKDRKAAGYSNEHTLMTEGNLLLKGLETTSLNLTVPEDTNYGFTFTDDATLEGENAATVTIQYYNTSGKVTIMTYDKNDGMYYGMQKWYKKQAAVSDGNTDDPVPFKNVVILKTDVTYDSDGLHVYMKLTGEGEGFLVRDGKYVPIKWSRASEQDPFTYTLADGSPAVFGVGKTFVSLLPSKSPDVIFE